MIKLILILIFLSFNNCDCTLNSTMIEIRNSGRSVALSIVSDIIEIIASGVSVLLGAGNFLGKF